MGKLTKNQKLAAEKIEAGKAYSLKEAAQLVKDITFSKFDASLDIDVRLGVDPRKANQMVRGVVSLPHGTGKQVRLLENNGHIELYDKESGKLICRHELCPGKGKNVCDKRHHKDKTRSVNDLQVRIRKRTEDDPTVILWLRNLEREKPRYYRDNMKLLLHVISEYGKETVIAALQTCLEKNIYNSLSVQEISGSIHRSKDNMNGMTFQAPTSIPETADCHPEKTDINQYNKFFE